MSHAAELARGEAELREAVARRVEGRAGGEPAWLAGLRREALARFAEEALRYSLLVPTGAPLISVVVCLLGANAVRADLDRAKAA